MVFHYHHEGIEYVDAYPVHPGTDIKLDPSVMHISKDVVQSSLGLDDAHDGSTLRKILLKKPGGLHVIGSERHESRRIDRQLRGRCARQGDPGSSRFYISLEDDFDIMMPRKLVNDVRECLADDDILTLDNGLYKVWFARNYPAYKPNTILLDNALATM